MLGHIAAVLAEKEHVKLNDRIWHFVWLVDVHYENVAIAVNAKVG